MDHSVEIAIATFVLGMIGGVWRYFRSPDKRDRADTERPSE